jgi:hypothetical protein
MVNKRSLVGVYCANHLNEKGVGNCLVCQKPICRKCLSKYGYYCSEGCLIKKGREMKSSIKESTRERKERSFLPVIFKIIYIILVVFSISLALYMIFKSRGDKWAIFFLIVISASLFGGQYLDNPWGNYLRIFPIMSSFFSTLCLLISISIPWACKVSLTFGFLISFGAYRGVYQGVWKRDF